uniref:ORF52 n=1 Tax=Malaco herpesvirus 1 TaxID=3031797 RepID=A0AA48P7S3_9VIRU|nr:TPA_asm: ORF52 [Malaco herpesvirus 1]
MNNSSPDTISPFLTVLPRVPCSKSITYTRSRCINRFLAARSLCCIDLLSSSCKVLAYRFIIVLRRLPLVNLGLSLNKLSPIQSITIRHNPLSNSSWHRIFTQPIISPASTAIVISFCAPSPSIAFMMTVSPLSRSVAL